MTLGDLLNQLVKPTKGDLTNRQTKMDKKQTHLQNQLTNITDALNNLHHAQSNATEQIGIIKGRIKSG